MTNTIKEGTAQKESAPAGTKGAIQNKHVDSIATPAPEQEVPAHKIAVPGGAVMLLPEAAAAINRHAAMTKRPMTPYWVNVMLSRHLSGDMTGTKVSRMKVTAGLSREKWCELSGVPLREEWEVRNEL